MQEDTYRFLRKLLFWISLLAFVLLAPTLLFYSLGYRFNFEVSEFQKTGVILVRSKPGHAKIYFNEKKLEGTTPHAVKDLLPDTYQLRIEKKGYYSYELPVRVESARVAEIEAVLIPQVRNIEKLAADIEVLNFFILKKAFTTSVILFSPKAMYLTDEKFEKMTKIVDLPFDDKVIQNILGVREDRHQYIFWTGERVWRVRMPAFQESFLTRAMALYSSRQEIRDVFFGLEERYLIIQDGARILALDVRQPEIHFTILETRDRQAGMFYDSDEDILYVRDRIANGQQASLYKIDLTELVHEKTSN